MYKAPEPIEEIDFLIQKKENVFFAFVINDTIVLKVPVPVHEELAISILSSNPKVYRLPEETAENVQIGWILKDENPEDKLD